VHIILRAFSKPEIFHAMMGSDIENRVTDQLAAA